MSSARNWSSCDTLNIPMSTSNRPLVLGLDLDDVVADFTEGFRQIIAREFDVHPSLLGEPQDWDMADWGVRDRDHFEELNDKAIIEQRILRTLPAIQDAPETLRHLHASGVFIRIITHRLRLRFRGAAALVVEDTAFWLEQNGIPYDDLCFTGDKDQVNADVYIDDAPHNIERFQATGKHAVIFSRGYNQSFAGPRVNTWPEFETYLRNEFPHRFA